MIFTDSKNIILEIIGRHDSNSPITMKQISEWCGLSKRETARAIHQLRLNGAVILSNGEGFFTSSNKNEILRFVRQMRSREREIRAARQSAESYLQELSVNGEV